MENKSKVEEFKEMMNKKKTHQEEMDIPVDQAESSIDEPCAANTELEKIKKERDQYKEDYVRLYADFENIKKRLEREKSEMSKYGVQKLVEDFLPVFDSLKQALVSANSEIDQKQVLEGVALVEKQFLQCLEKYGVVLIESLGKSFDPNLHEAIATEESEDHEPDTVIKEWRSGFRIHDRLLRPAMVVTSKKKT